MSAIQAYEKTEKRVILVLVVLQKLPKICKISSSQNAEHLRQNRCGYRLEAVARKWQVVQAVLHFLKPGNRRKQVEDFLNL